MQFRPQRGSLEDSMQSVVTLPPTRRALFGHLVAERLLRHGQTEGNVAVKPYAVDDRIGWRTHLVTVGGQAVGFTDGPLEL